MPLARLPSVYSMSRCPGSDDKPIQRPISYMMIWKFRAIILETVVWRGAEWARVGEMILVFTTYIIRGSVDAIIVSAIACGPGRPQSAV